MGTFILSLLFTATLAVSPVAQNGYEQQMQQALALWEEGNIEEAVDLFEKASITEPQNWLPHYYASLVKVSTSFEMTNRELKEKQLEEALQHLKQAENLKGKEHVELLVLRAMWNTGYITLEPETYGPELYPVVSSLYAKANKQSPENPRVVLSLAEWNMGAAPFMGSDPALYCSDVERSLPLFETFEVKEKFAPQWGAKRAKAVLAQTCGM